MFTDFAYLLYPVGVIFQQSFRPSGSMFERKLYYSWKHKPYGYQVEVAVLPYRLAIGCSDYFSGNVLDMEII